MTGVVDLHERLSLFSEHWSPKVVARLNDYAVKVVKLKGEFVWHSHPETDELQPSEALRTLQATFPQSLHYVSADVTRRPDIEGLVAAARERFGAVDVLFNNAAVFDTGAAAGERRGLVRPPVRVNVKGMFFVMQARAAAHGRRRRQGGSVINMASQAGRRGEALVSHYCATKAAVISYTQSAALAMAPHGIRVNAIAPGVVDTPMWSAGRRAVRAVRGAAAGREEAPVGLAVPLGRMGTPDDIAGAAVFLASDEARYITAQTLNVDGGNVMS